MPLLGHVITAVRPIGAIFASGGGKIGGNGRELLGLTTLTTRRKLRLETPLRPLERSALQLILHPPFAGRSGFSFPSSSKQVS
jgi:hypothetical protein